MFEKYIIDYQDDIFEQLVNSCKFENITEGRKATNLIDYKNDLIPIVRTTSVYHESIQLFKPIHYDIIDKIKRITNNNYLKFNNALIEIYDSRYRNMKFHSDQALDLADDSFICLFSCYDKQKVNTRKLKIKNKTTLECSEISLDHNSVVLFSTTTNRNYLHKIVLEGNASNDKWLGITFRLSKTFVKFVDEIPYFYQTGIILKMANDDEKRQFIKYRSQENSSVTFCYPEINYTISVSDMLMVNTNVYNTGSI